MLDFVRRWSTQIQAQLSNLTVSQKMAIGLTMVVMFGMLILFAVYAYSPEMVPLVHQPMEPAQLSRATSVAKAHNVKHEIRDNMLYVPADPQIIAQLLAGFQTQDLLPEDTRREFNALIEQQTWWKTSGQNRQAYNIALQNALSNVIGSYPWVTHAQVFISWPRSLGFGVSHHRPSASVNVYMDSGSLNRKRVEGLAGLVSGAVAEMRREDVTVIDAVTGRQWRVRPVEDGYGGDYLEQVQQWENYKRQSIVEVLGIPKAIVAVNVAINTTRKRIKTVTYNEDKSAGVPLREVSRSSDNTDTDTAGEAGVRANVGASLVEGSGPGHKSETDDKEKEYLAGLGSEQIESTQPDGQPTSIAATINVPRSFFVALFRQNNQPDAEPADADLQPIIDKHTDQIRTKVMPLLKAEAPGELAVGMFYDDALVMGVSGEPVSAGLGSTFVARGGLKLLGLAGLVGVTLMIMLMMVRKASRLPRMPTPEEIAGLPPTLPSDHDVIGEVDESEPALAGVELGEDQIRGRKIAEQVSELIRNRPTDAAGLVGRWVRSEE